MRTVRTLVNVQLPYYFSEAMRVVKILVYEAVIIMVALGFLYILNFRISIVPTVKIISPITTEAQK